MKKFEGSITAKEEAQELINRFYYSLPNNGSLDIGVNNCSQRMQEANRCALISIIKILEVLRVDLFDTDNRINYYEEVKKEIVCIIFQKK